MSTSHGHDDEERIRTTRNTARYFTENRHVAWIALVATVVWGILSYVAMPKRKDPEIPVRVAAAIVAWPGAGAEKIEQLVTRKVEEKISENAKVEHIDSTTRTGVAVVIVALQEGVKEPGKEFDDIKLKLDTLDGQLPQGVQPIVFLKDFGDTTALMLTVASPKSGEVELQLRADKIKRGIADVRKDREPAPSGAKRVSLVYSFPATVDSAALRRVLEHMGAFAMAQKIATDIKFFQGTGYMGLDGVSTQSEAEIRQGALLFLKNRMNTAELHPDVWRAIVVFDPEETEPKLSAVAESRYSYRELDEFTDALKKRLQSVPEVAKVTRAGVLPEAVFLDYSQERASAYGVQGDLRNLIGARNITAPGGVVEAPNKKLSVDPSGELRDEREIGDILMTTSTQGAPVYLRDLFDVERGYESPPRYLNKLTYRTGKKGEWSRTRAITLAVYMRSGMQIGAFGKAVDAALAESRQLLPEDLVVARTSDQPRQVEENVDLFMSSLYEAVALVVFVALIGFWEWRSAAVLAMSIPITLFMTYGLMYLLGIDLQQISIASLIIALGLLVDDPVVAGDAIKRDLALGHPPIVAAWLGPTKLARAILFATITNIVAYLPFLTLPGDVGRFIFTLPVVLTCSLVASRLVSMTFIPLLGYYFLRPSKGESSGARVTDEERRSKGFARHYYRVVGWALDHRWKVLAISVVLLFGAFAAAGRLKQAFFPKDLSYLSYVDVWLPEDAPLSATAETARHADEVIRKTVDEWEKEHPERAKDHDGKPRGVLKSITTFIGGGGPRFWFSVTPEVQQANYAQLVVEAADKHDTSDLIEPLQRALSSEVPGARIDVRQLENGKPVGIPVAFRIQGDDIQTLREIADKAKAVLRASPIAERVRDSWGADSFSVKIQVDSDRANLAGVTNLDVAQSSAIGFSGLPVGQLREGDRLIPIVSRLRSAERGQLSDVQNLYVRSQQTGQRVPLRQVSTVTYSMTTEKIVRRDHFRTITVNAFPVAGTLPSQVVLAVKGDIEKLAKTLPPGYTLTIAGEQEEQQKGFLNLAVVLGISVFAIYLALVVQLKSATKPIVVFAAIPYGVAGALVCLVLARSPFGFMAFLGIISLIGVIVSHVIVLFDFIEERHEEGAPLREALLDAGILRLRPVLITVGATVFALFPLASHGGPLWEPLCYAQIGGLTIATFLTLLLVPVIYSIFVLDLKLVAWEERPPRGETTTPSTSSTPSTSTSP
ncbi:MAG: efflux RND transporter permease subunit [Deltaproteobacteria bacterium]|nr:efflux RND transporter permease subunit [Deltaproteobacteria bacterium]